MKMNFLSKIFNKNAINMNLGVNKITYFSNLNTNSICNNTTSLKMFSSRLRKIEKLRKIEENKGHILYNSKSL